MEIDLSLYYAGHHLIVKCPQGRGLGMRLGLDSTDQINLLS